MSTGADTRIAGEKTVADWNTIRDRLLQSATGAWDEAFTDYFEARLHLRYLNPIKILQENDTLQGEGFSILTIQCSLIEFLESTAQGTNYRYRDRERGEVLGPHEYSSSKEVFIAFLRDRAPFSNIFNKASARDFYVGVRCALLHEARTKNGWRIWADSPDGLVANVKERIVYRNSFHSALLDYIEDYGAKLLLNADLQHAFIRKFDDLCV